MALRDKIPAIVEHIKANFEETVGYQRDLINILEGNLLSYVLQVMKRELSPKAYERSKGRVPAINVLSRLVDKLSQLYIDAPTREVAVKNVVDSELLDVYESSTGVNSRMDFANRLYNTNKRFAIEPYVEDGVPLFRVLAANEFIPFSDHPKDKTKMTVFIKFGEIYTDDYMPLEQKLGKSTFYLYSDDEVIKITGAGEEIEIEDNPDGVNSYGVIPFIYARNSYIDLIPQRDTDTFTMATLIPLIFSDLNYATQFLSHSVFYGIDIDVNNLEMNPDAFWQVSSKNGEGKSPSIGTIKPEVDIDKVLASIKEQLYMWLDSKGIRASGFESANTASGIAKVIDEADATSARRKQLNKFIEVEARLWQLVKVMHEVWVRSGEIKERRLFSKDFYVDVNFGSLEPVTDTKKELEEIKLKLDMGLISKRMAVKESNPMLDDEQIDALLKEIEDEKKSNVETMQQTFQGDEGGEDTELKV